MPSSSSSGMEVSRLKKARNATAQTETASYFSFTISDDDATQWFAYGDSARAACIAFQPDSLEIGAGGQSMQVAYRQYGLDPIAKKLHNKWDKLIAEDHDQESSTFQFDIAEELADEAVSACLFIQGAGFETE